MRAWQHRWTVILESVSVSRGVLEYYDTVMVYGLGVESTLFMLCLIIRQGPSDARCEIAKRGTQLAIGSCGQQ